MFYSEDGVKFYSKFHAIDYRNKTGKQVYLYYHDEVYSSLDWKAEPVETLDQLYKEQAQRIRDTYDYVVLCYSGGYDSTNILESFYYNNIALDKIAIVGAFNKDSISGVDENHNGELYHNAFPYIEQLGLSNITQVYDYTSMLSDIENFSIIKKYGTDWYHHVGSYFTVQHWFWHDAYDHIVPSQWKDKKVALIMGIDKPIIRYVNGKPYFRFMDSAITSYGNLKRLNFYWDPEFPKILIKQIRCVLRMNEIPRDKDHMDNIANRAVYNLKRPLIYKSPKSITPLISPKDTYIRTATSTDAYKMYKHGISQIKTMQPDVIYSKPYML